jgi:hypothetical protein
MDKNKRAATYLERTGLLVDQINTLEECVEVAIHVTDDETRMNDREMRILQERLFGLGRNTAVGKVRIWANTNPFLRESVLYMHGASSNHVPRACHRTMTLHLRTAGYFCGRFDEQRGDPFFFF